MRFTKKTMANNIVRATMRRGFRAYFMSCMPNAQATNVVETIMTQENIRQRNRREARPQNTRDKIRGFYATVCEGDLGECAICYEPIQTGEDIIVLNCKDHGIGHSFHEQCIAKWLASETSCPICRCKVL